MPSTDWDKRNKFIQEYVTRGCGKSAAIAAGVPPKSAAVVAHKWLRNPDIASRIRTETEQQVNQLGPLAISTIKMLIESPETPPATKLQACRDILDRGGHIPPKRSEMKVNLADRKITELTREELMFIAAGGEDRNLGQDELIELSLK